MALRLHHSNRVEGLAAAFAAILRAEPGDPMDPERIVVPHRTIGRWLSFELARELGIAANLRFELPAGFAWSFMRGAVSNLPREHGFSPDQLRWRIHDLLPAFAADDGVGRAVRQYLADGDPRKRFELADRLARVFDRCVVYRPDWVRAWDGGDAPCWQARLWQRVVGEERPTTHWVAAIDAFRAALESGVRPTGWPRRASFFAVPSLSPSYLEVLSGVGEVIDLNLFVLNPCREYWGDIYSRQEIGRRADGADPAERYLTEGNELLAAWGRAGRDTFDSLGEIAGDAEDEHFVQPEGSRRLAAVQRDVLALRLASEGRSAEEGEQGDGARERDDSIRIHVCHSPVREAEVLHDRLLGLFDAHPDLAPADVLVLTPDLDRYGPAVEAVFGTAARIPFRAARRRSIASPAVRAFFELLSMPRSRLGAETVLAPLEAEAVRVRFGIAESDPPSIRSWVREAGIRWGVDAAHREAEGLPATGEHSWRQGLRRLLLGYALPDPNELVAGLVPCPPRVGGFESGVEEAALLGRLATFCEQVFELRTRLAGERHPREWARALREEIGRFFAGSGSPAGGGGPVPGPTGAASVTAAVAEEVGELRDLVRDFEREAARAASAIGFDVVRQVLAELADAPPREPVRLADAVTVTSLTPGQVFPAEVVCVIGLNDGAFPRSPSFPSFDLVASSPARRGDRDVRHEDRFVFLEALLAARRAFLVSYTGRGQRDDAPLPPATVVDELEDYLGRRFPGGSFVVNHPLQPFSPRYFAVPGHATGVPAAETENVAKAVAETEAGGAGGATEAELFSFSEDMCEAARSMASGGAEGGNPARFETALPGPREAAVSPLLVPLSDLIAFFANPVRWFLRERLGVRLELDEARLDDEEPFELDSLERYWLRTDILDGMRAGVSQQRDEAVRRGSGRLPHAALGRIVHDRVWNEMAGLSQSLDRYPVSLRSAPVAIDFELEGFRVTGMVENAGPDGLVWWRPAGLRPRDRIAVRLSQLALAVAGHEPATAVALSIVKNAVRETSFAAPGGASERLTEWLDAWREGLCGPLSFFPESSLAYAEAVAGGADDTVALAKARTAWSAPPTPWSRGGERLRDPCLRLVFDGHDPLSDRFEELATDLLVPLVKAVQ